MSQEILENEESKENEDKGATMVEYALLVALMAIALIAAVNFMKTGTSQRFSQIGSALNPVN
jgi:pilus assembly protein Flp/PilA